MNKNKNSYTKYQTIGCQVTSNHSDKTKVNSGTRVSSKRKLVCYCCGKVGHIKQHCKYLNYTCSVCSKVGHLQNVCKNKGKNVNNIDLDNVDLNLSNLFNVKSVDVNFIKPLYIQLEVNGESIDFQVDTESAVTDK